MKERMPEEPNIPPGEGPALSLDGNYSALPMQQGGAVKDDEDLTEADELGAYVLVVGTEAERHEQEKETMPDQLIVQPKEVDEEAGE